MKAGEVLQLLRISRPTLRRYVLNSTIKATRLPSGQLNYKDQSVYKLLLKGDSRKTYAYARVSTRKQAVDLDNQIESLKQFCVARGYHLDDIFSDVTSGISFSRRKQFFKLLEDVLNHRVARVVITYKDRLSRVGFELFIKLFAHFGTEIVVISDVGDAKLDSKELFEEIISLLHCYSIKLYPGRRVARIKKALKDDPS